MKALLIYNPQMTLELDIWNWLKLYIVEPTIEYEKTNTTGGIIKLDDIPSL